MKRVPAGTLHVFRLTPAEVRELGTAHPEILQDEAALIIAGPRQVLALIEMFLPQSPVGTGSDPAEDVRDTEQ
jgi:hypothetical protein